jgi:hypothetical protein
MIGKFLEDPTIPIHVRFRQIGFRNTLSEAEMISLRSMRVDGKTQVTQAISVAQLAVHHAQQLIPAGEMPHTIIPLITVGYHVKGPLRKKCTYL